jgi:metal-sulfur cluster biosynthetic enzyme
MSKENENPQLFSVENANRYAHTERAPLDWTKLGSFVQEQNEIGTAGSTTTVVIPTSAEDKAILRALMDSSRSTKNGRGVGLLRKAGLSIPTFSSDVVGVGLAGRAKAASSSCYGDSSRPVFRLAEDDGDDKAVSVPKTKEIQIRRERNEDEDDQDKDIDESKISAEEIFDIIRTIEDPEHPNSLEQLGVVSLEQVQLSLAKTNNRNQNEVTIRFTPTIPHCSMATLIGLCLRVKLHRSLPPAKFKVDVSIEPGTHVSEKAINKQLRDKERVRAALENQHLKGVVDKCIRNGMMK